MRNSITTFVQLTFHILRILNLPLLASELWFNNCSISNPKPLFIFFWILNQHQILNRLLSSELMTVQFWIWNWSLIISEFIINYFFLKFVSTVFLFRIPINYWTIPNSKSTPSFVLLVNRTLFPFQFWWSNSTTIIPLYINHYINLHRAFDMYWRLQIVKRMLYCQNVRYTGHI